MLLWLLLAHSTLFSGVPSIDLEALIPTCAPTPLSTSAASTFSQTGRTAYVFYATRPLDVCNAALVCDELLRLGVGAAHDLVLLYSARLPTSALTPFERIAARMTERGGIGRARLMPVPVLRVGDGGLGAAEWSESFTRFHAWTLTQYARVIVLDSDVLLLRPLDALFDVKLPTSMSIAAVPAHWKEDINRANVTVGLRETDPLPTAFTSVTLVVQPNVTQYEALVAQIGAHPGYWDMNILNSYYASHWVPLPLDYAALDGHYLAWRDAHAHRRSGTGTDEMPPCPAVVHYTGRRYLSLGL